MNALESDLARLGIAVRRLDTVQNIESRRRCIDAYEVRFASLRELQRIMRYAWDRHIPVAPIGQQLSGGVIAVPASGIVIRGINDAVSQCGSTGYRVQAAATWRQVAARLRGFQRVPKVLHAAGDATVVGSVSLGGFGPHSLTRGAQFEHVRRVRLVIANGTALVASWEEHLEILRAALCGFGAIGCIEHVVLDSLPAETRAIDQEISFPNIAAAVSFLGLLPSLHGTPDAIALRITNTQCVARVSGDAACWKEIGRFVSASAVPFGRGEVITRLDIQPTRLRRIWRHFVIPFDGLPVLEETIAEIRREAIARSLECRFLLMPCKEAQHPSVTTPWLSPLQHLRGWGLGIGLHFNAKRGQVEEARALQRSFRRVCLAVAGLPYAQAVTDCTETELRHCFGSNLNAWRAIKTNVDPNGTMNPEVSYRLGAKTIHTEIRSV